MIIDPATMDTTRLEHFNGGEGALEAKMFIDQSGLGKFMRGHLEPGSSIGLHTHETSSEIIYFLEGRGHCLYEGELEEVKAGQFHYCPKGKSHCLINDSDAPLEFVAVVPEQ